MVNNKRIGFIVSYYNFDLNLYKFSKDFFEKAGFKVLTIAKCNVDKIKEDYKLGIDIDLNKTKIDVKDFSALFTIANTMSSKNCLDDEKVNQIISDAVRNKIYLGSIHFENKKELIEYLKGSLKIFD